MHARREVSGGVNEPPSKRLRTEGYATIELPAERRESHADASSPWSTLPDGVMERISNDISSSTSTTCAFRLVCPAWKAAHDAQLQRLAPRRLDQSLSETTARLFPRLRTLDLGRANTSEASIDGILSALSSSNNLQELELGAETYLSLEAPVGRLADVPSLRHLNLAGNLTVDDDVVDRLLGAMPNLISLDLNGCEGITDRSLQTVARLGRLRVLRLADCDNLTDGGLGVLGALTALIEIELSGCCGISDVGLAFLDTLPELEYLGLKCCEGVTDDGVRHIARCCPALTHLNLGWCGITDSSLTTICKSLRGLHYLNLSWCDQISDFGACQLAELKRLRQLKLKGCTLITNGAVSRLAELKELQSLNMKLCIQVSALSLQPLRQQLPLLRDVKSWCDSFSIEPVDFVTCQHVAIRPREAVAVSVACQ